MQDRRRYDAWNECPAQVVPSIVANEVDAESGMPGRLIEVGKERR